jgi:hypothetical protein
MSKKHFAFEGQKNNTLTDHLVGTGDQCRRNGKPIVRAVLEGQVLANQPEDQLA